MTGAFVLVIGGAAAVAAGAHPASPASAVAMLVAFVSLPLWWPILKWCVFQERYPFRVSLAVLFALITGLTVISMAVGKALGVPLS